MEGTKVIVSLTSYPKRIVYVEKVIKVLLIQTMKPDKIILWLAESDFLNKIDDLPPELVMLCNYGLEIRWCKDMKSHKKYLYTMKEYVDYCVITVDDDVYYFPDMVEILYKSYLRHPHDVSCLRANRITFNSENKIDIYSRWIFDEQEFIDNPLMDLMAVGMGGVLYPPGCIEEQFLDENKIMELSLYQDDIWLKYAQIHSGVRTVVAEAYYSKPKIIKGTEEDSLSKSTNVLGNDIALKRVGDFFNNLHKELNYIDKEILLSNDTCMKIIENQRKQAMKTMDELKNGSIVIYGAGKDAHVVYDCLRNFGDKFRVNCVVVTCKSENLNSFYDIPVVQIDDMEIKENTVIIVAMDECWHKEIACVLKKRKKCKVFFVSNKQMGAYFSRKKALEKYKENFFASLKEENIVDG